jgi:hypothetical protein
MFPVAGDWADEYNAYQLDETINRGRRMRLRRWTWLTALLAGLAITAATASAQEGAKPAEALQARLEVRQNTFDFGYVPQGASISHVFWVKNVGGDTLRITDVRTG